MLIPQSGQANFSLNNKSSPPMIFTITIPSPNPKAVSKESASLPRISSLRTNLSTTASMLCLVFFTSFTSSSDISTIWPSILALTYPFFFMFSITFICSPFLPFIIGAKICSLVFSGSSIILSTI